MKSLKVYRTDTRYRAHRQNGISYFSIINNDDWWTTFYISTTERAPNTTWVRIIKAGIVWG
jgi:hypothetical protein